jgi:YHS domain-containing protein
MKSILTLLAVSFVAAGIASAAPVNTTCPMSGKDVKAGVTSEYKGKTIGFCCTNCKAKFDSNPDKFGKKFR